MLPSLGFRQSHCCMWSTSDGCKRSCCKVQDRGRWIRRRCNAGPEVPQWPRVESPPPWRSCRRFVVRLRLQRRCWCIAVVLQRVVDRGVSLVVCGQGILRRLTPNTGRHRYQHELACPQLASSEPQPQIRCLSAVPIQVKSALASLVVEVDVTVSVVVAVWHWCWWWTMWMWLVCLRSIV